MSVSDNVLADAFSRFLRSQDKNTEMCLSGAIGLAIHYFRYFRLRLTSSEPLFFLPGLT